MWSLWEGETGRILEYIWSLNHVESVESSKRPKLSGSNIPNNFLKNYICWWLLVVKPQFWLVSRVKLMSNPTSHVFLFHNPKIPVLASTGRLQRHQAKAQCLGTRFSQKPPSFDYWSKEKHLQEGLEKPPGLEFRKSFEHSFETLRFWSWMRYFLHLFLKATFAGHHVYSVCTYTGVPIV